MTIIATCTCIIRADFNFAFGLLGYYMMKTTNRNKMDRTLTTLLGIVALLIAMDIVWCMTMRSVWSNKPVNNKSNWPIFDHMRTLTLIFSYIGIGVKVAIIGSILS